MQPTKIAVIGASGYSGEELVRYLLGHPGVEIVCVTSRQHVGRRLQEVFPRFRKAGPAAQLRFIDPDVRGVVASGAEAAFLALPHGVSAGYASALLDAGLRVIDLSADFRLRDPAVYEEYYGHPHPHPALLQEAVYGLPEIRADAIRTARLVASPGCYPTSVLLPLLPLVRAGSIDPATVHVFSMSGVSGAGRKESPQLLFCECNESVRAYSVPKHRHLSEIEQELSLAAGKPAVISFAPHLVPVHAGICTTTYAAPGSGEQDLGKIYEAAYGDSPFVRLLGENQCPDTKNVAGTNFIDIGWAFDRRTGRHVILSAEDNIGKGAGGQAVQSFNLMFGHPETTGLLLV
ncbi:MAG: N-acetyl-gamma-glutamyl-phosphate reductase [Verrucomicrobiales bacterium]|nr:N-acetyl-gamma-glutamyl-phosphate reductase [Verrucomicrobiales bacterium]